MTLDAHEFIRRFLIHVLPNGFHRIRHYGLLASGVKADTIAGSPASCSTSLRHRRPSPRTSMPSRPRPSQPCPCCGGRMRVIEMFEAGRAGAT